MPRATLITAIKKMGYLRPSAQLKGATSKQGNHNNLVDGNVYLRVFI